MNEGLTWKEFRRCANGAGSWVPWDSLAEPSAEPPLPETQSLHLLHRVVGAGSPQVLF